MWMSEKQKETLEYMKKIDDLRKGEIIDIVMKLTDRVIDTINDRNGEVEHDITETLAQLLVETDFRMLITQSELPGVTMHTFNALTEKAFLEESEPFGIDGAMYWRRTGKELE